MDFSIVCLKCGNPVSGDPMRHIVEAHAPIEFFAFVPNVPWSKLGVSLPPVEKENPLKA